MNKFLVALFVTTATAIAAFADVEIYRGGGRCANGNVIRVSYRHVPLSDPSQPNHETYRKNLGEIRTKAEKPVANIHAKQSAAQADALRYAAKLEQAQCPTISVYSNVTARPPTPRRADATDGGGRNITINNSNVVINNN